MMFIAGFAAALLVDLVTVIVLRRKFRDALDLLIERAG